MLRRSHILKWALSFFIVAIIAAIFGFGGIAAAAKILFFIFIVICVLFLVLGRSVRDDLKG